MFRLLGQSLGQDGTDLQNTLKGIDINRNLLEEISWKVVVWQKTITVTNWKHDAGYSWLPHHPLT